VQSKGIGGQVCAAHRPACSGTYARPTLRASKTAPRNSHTCIGGITGASKRATFACLDSSLPTTPCAHIRSRTGTEGEDAHRYVRQLVFAHTPVSIRASRGAPVRRQASSRGARARAGPPKALITVGSGVMSAVCALWFAWPGAGAGAGEGAERMSGAQARSPRGGRRRRRLRELEQLVFRGVVRVDLE
jgi:hypothetical protein